MSLKTVTPKPRERVWYHDQAAPELSADADLALVCFQRRRRLDSQRLTRGEGVRLKGVTLSNFRAGEPNAGVGSLLEGPADDSRSAAA